MYHQGLEISIPQYARFKEVAQLAASKKQSLLILPCHKSHIVHMTFSLRNRMSSLMRFSAPGLLEYAGQFLYGEPGTAPRAFSASRDVVGSSTARLTIS